MPMVDFNKLTTKLFPYAYNILGSVADSEDVVQDVLIKFNSQNDAGIANPKAYLIKAVIHRAINLRKKNERVRSQHIQLPEPLVTNSAVRKIETEEILSYSMLVLLDALNAKERGVFLLKEVFDYTHEETGEVLAITVDNSRQLLARAKKKLKRPKPALTRTDITYLKQYVESIRKGDVKSLEAMLSHDIRMLADGGQKLKVVAEQTVGIADTLKLIIYLYEFYQKDFTIQIEEINHQPALLFYKNSELINCQVFACSPEGQIEAIYSVVDPDKLTRI